MAQKTVYAFGQEMYNALKEATKEMTVINTTVQFNDEEQSLSIGENTTEWYLISMGYHACKIIHNIKE